MRSSAHSESSTSIPLDGLDGGHLLFVHIVRVAPLLRFPLARHVPQRLAPEPGDLRPAFQPVRQPVRQFRGQYHGRSDASPVTLLLCTRSSWNRAPGRCHGRPGGSRRPHTPSRRARWRHLAGARADPSVQDGPGRVVPVHSCAARPGGGGPRSLRSSAATNLARTCAAATVRASASTRTRLTGQGAPSLHAIQDVRDKWLGITASVHLQKLHVWRIRGPRFDCPPNGPEPVAPKDRPHR